jgi:outer membrane usher protein
MRWQLRSPFDKQRVFSLALILVVLVLSHHGSTAEEEARRLELEVYINDAPANLIGSFTQLADRRMAVRRAELTEIGLKVPGSGADDELIIIDDLTGVAYRYDEPAQKIYFNVRDDRRLVKTFDAHNPSDGIGPVRSDFGSVLNYTLFASSIKPLNNGAFAFSGANATLDARAFGPYGTLSQSAIVGTTTTQDVSALRLDTTWAYSNPETLLTYRAGDFISGGLSWTRPVRLGGLQMQRNFALRPDLVTLPLPTVSGSAAVPSTVDVYVNNLKTLSQQVPAGPFQVTNVPVLSGGGTAQVVVRDAAGHQTQTSLPFYTTPKLLREGFMDFSVEAGLPRVQYGTASNSYLNDPVGSASLRGGLTDWLTVEAHSEGGAGLMNGGLGAVTSLSSTGVVSVAGSASRFSDMSGFQSYVAYDKQFAAFSIHASSLRTFGTYIDLAAVTAYYLPAVAAYQGFASVSASPSLLLTNIMPPKSIDTFSVGFPLPFDKASLNLSLLHEVLQDSTRSDIASVSYSRSIFSNGSLFVTAFSDISNRTNSGVFIGISMPLGDTPSDRGSIVASTTVSATPTGTNVTFEAAKAIQPVPGSYGWDLRDNEGQTPYRSAEASYRSSVAQFDGYVQQAGMNTSASIQAQGAVASMGGGVFFANHIDDAFAVIDAGAPDVDVLYENRPAGKTNGQGLLLIPSLRSYQKNQIAIDPRGLPVDAEVPTTHNIAAPADRSGVNVRFGIKTDIKAAVVILVDKSGTFIAPGSQGKRDGANEAFVVGYDGRAYIKDLGDANTVVLTDARGQCRASFPFTPKKNSQVVIGPVVCQ